MYKRYGQPNDLLVRLNVFNFRVCDVPIKPVYNIGEKSGIKPLRMIPKLSWLLFNPSYGGCGKNMSFVIFTSGVFLLDGFLFVSSKYSLGIKGAYSLVSPRRYPAINALVWMSSIGLRFTITLFAMWFDMEYDCYAR